MWTHHLVAHLKSGTKKERKRESGSEELSASPWEMKSLPPGRFLLKFWLMAQKTMGESSTFIRDDLLFFPEQATPNGTSWERSTKYTPFWIGITPSNWFFQNMGRKLLTDHLHMASLQWRNASKITDLNLDLEHKVQTFSVDIAVPSFHFALVLRNGGVLVSFLLSDVIFLTSGLTVWEERERNKAK